MRSIITRVLPVLAVWVLAVWTLATSAGPSAAAELKIEFRELAAIATQALGAPKVRLHTAPPDGIFDFSQGSYVQFGSTVVPVTLKDQQFKVAGGFYSFYFNDLNTTGVKIEPAEGAVRLTLEFETSDPEIIVRCRSGFCPVTTAMPRIEWNEASVSIDLAPVAVDGSLALEARRITIGGTPRPACPSGANLISGGVCQVIRTAAAGAISRQRKDLDEKLRQLINKPELQAKIADLLRPRLVFGPAGALKIRSVRTASTAVTISFCLACTN